MNKKKSEFCWNWARSYCSVVNLDDLLVNDRKIIQTLSLLSTFRLFQRFTGQLPSTLKLAGDSLSVKEYTVEDFCKVFKFSSC